MSDAGSPAAASNGAAHPRTASGTSYSHPHLKIAPAAYFDKSPWDTPSLVSCCDTFSLPSGYVNNGSRSRTPGLLGEAPCSTPHSRLEIGPRDCGQVTDPR